MSGLDLEGHGRLDRASALRVDVDLLARSELAALFRTTGLALPPPLGDVRGSFGTATLEVSLKGPPADPALLRIVPRLSFEPSAEAVSALRYLQGPFRYTPEGSPGTVIDVRHGAPDFVPLDQVPPLFVQAIVLSEDAGFFGHPGIDVAEIPVAWATNLDRGRTARGASTITQQLARNLFLSKDKSWGRKLTEAGLALVLDSAVPKQRLLEIYLNVIEWGPRLYGLGPAAQHYFGKSPSALTPKETAFLVCLIPSPVRYHQAHLAGQAGPGMEQLMANLLAKLRTTGALSEREYQSALAESLSFRPETAEAQ
jgi:membrane peptidoglycan carboxypeptidase